MLADDLHQQGREAMALSLMKFAKEKLARVLAWEGEALMRLAHARRARGASAKLIDEFSRRHYAIGAASLAEGLDVLSRGGLPLRPLEFRDRGAAVHRSAETLSRAATGRADVPYAAQLASCFNPKPSRRSASLRSGDAA